MAMAAAQSRVSLMGLDFDALTETEAVATILDTLKEGRGGWVVTPNLEYLRAYQLADDVQREFDSADLVVPDGMPLLWASRLKNEPLPGRVAGSNLIWSMSGAAARRGASVLFVGGQPGTAEEAAARLRREYPGLRVRGADLPSTGFERDQASVAAMAREAAALRPDIVFVGLPLAKYLLLARALRRRASAGLGDRRGSQLQLRQRRHRARPGMDPAPRPRVAPPTRAGAPPPLPPLCDRGDPIRPAPARLLRAGPCGVSARAAPGPGGSEGETWEVSRERS